MSFKDFMLTEAEILAAILASVSSKHQVKVGGTACSPYLLALLMMALIDHHRPQMGHFEMTQFSEPSPKPSEQNHEGEKKNIRTDPFLVKHC